MYPNHLCLHQRLHHPRARLIPVSAPHNQLCNHRVIERRNRVAHANTTIHPNVSIAKRRMGRQGQIRERAHRRQKVFVWVLSINTRFDRMPATRQLLLCQRQGLATRHTQLPLYQVEPSNHLSNRVFNLQARVHLHEIKTAAWLNNKLNGTCTHIVHGACRGNCSFAHRTASLFCHARRRRLFNHFLMAPLH